MDVGEEGTINRFALVQQIWKANLGIEACSMTIEYIPCHSTSFARELKLSVRLTFAIMVLVYIDYDRSPKGCKRFVGTAAIAAAFSAPTAQLMLLTCRCVGFGTTELASTRWKFWIWLDKQKTERVVPRLAQNWKLLCTRVTFTSSTERKK